MINKIIELLPIIPCQEATRLMSLSMERKLTFKESVNLKLHLKVCDFCILFQKHMQGLRHILRSYLPQKERTLSLIAKNQIKATINKAI